MSETVNESRTVRASAFELVDEQGGIRARLALADGQPSLTFLDPRGRVRLRFRVEDEGVAAIDVRDADGGLAAELSSDRAGPALQFFRSDGSLAAEIGVTDEGPVVLLRNDGEAITVQLGEDPAGSIGLILNGRSGGVERAAILVTTDGDVSLALAGGDGSVRQGLAVNEAGATRAIIARDEDAAAADRFLATMGRRLLGRDLRRKR